jgi:Holliday junction resolvase RusA-like endonuclease
MKQIEFTVQGTPKGQPRVRACIRGKHAGVYDPGTADEWKRAVRDAAKSAMAASGLSPFGVAVRLNVSFLMPRPKSHLDSKGNVKSLARAFHTSKPDLDNLVKATKDALTDAGIWTDDSFVVACQSSKGYGWTPGATIRIAEVVL